MLIPERLQNAKWQPKQPWPEDCFIQWGGHGIVLKAGTIDDVLASGDLEQVKQNTSYRTAFVEVSPAKPSTFIRGEGETIDAAEMAAWAKYTKTLKCPGHEYERKGYKSGAGICKNCGMFASDVFEPSEKCVLCGTPSWYALDMDGNVYCKNCDDKMPRDKWPKWRVEMLEIEDEEQIQEDQ
jgi:hypothetical protein